MSKPTSADIVKKLQKDHGAEIGGLGDKYVNLPRLPTGIFPLDLAMGGGPPLGKMGVIYGPESSNKTNMIIAQIKVGQVLYPDKKAVVVDAEQAWDSTWAEAQGVDMSRVIVLHPDYAEQCVDIVESFLYAPDVYLVALDSIAALITQNEIDSSAEKAVVGGSSAVVGKMVRKAVLALGQARKQNPDNFSPAFVCINQIRHKIGVMFGDPETMPGGNALRFAASWILRAYGKNEIDNKINDAMPAYKDVSCILKKWKFPILNVKATYKMQMLPFGGNQPGFVNDWNTVFAYLRELDYLAKKPGGGWLFSGETYQSLDLLKDWFTAHPQDLIEAKQTIISEMMEQGHIKESAETTEEEPDL